MFRIVAKRHFHAAKLQRKIEKQNSSTVYLTQNPSSSIHKDTKAQSNPSRRKGTKVLVIKLCVFYSRGVLCRPGDAQGKELGLCKGARSREQEQENSNPLAPCPLPLAPEEQKFVGYNNDLVKNFLNSETWEPFQNRLIIYDATVKDETVNGVKYHYYRDATETRCLTNNDKREMIDNHLLMWSADYQNLNIADLLNTKGDCTVYYTSVVGARDGDIDDADGVMCIYNDMGSNYNYKTLALGRNAIAGNEHVKAIEF